MEVAYQDIAKNLNNIIQEEWEKVYLYAELDEDYEIVFFYYYPKESSDPVYSLDILRYFDIGKEDFID